MNIELNVSSVSGSIQIPASKSMMQRVCAAALLHRGTTTIKNYGKSNDDKAAISIIESLGAELRFADGELLISSDGYIKNCRAIHCGESGLSARLFTPIAALGEQPVRIEASGSLTKRPMDFFQEILPSLGVQLKDFNGFIPFTLQGPIEVKDISVDGSISSQFISGLLFAFAAKATKVVTVTVSNLVSKPYIDLSLDVLEHFGKKISNSDYRVFEIDPSKFNAPAHIDVTIEGDWSSAAVWIAAATIQGSLSLKGLNPKSAQADKVILDIVQQIGARTSWDINDVLTISNGSLNAFVADLTDAPDLFPVLAVLASCCDGKSSLNGLHRLTYKESNRTESIVALLNQLQVSFSIEKDTLIIEGKKSFPAIDYTAPNDHRMAMAAALAALRCEGVMNVVNAEATEKSYPAFWNDVSTYFRPE